MLEFRKVSRIALFAMLVGFAAVAWAQKDAGAIVGLVRDQSGAVVPAAKVTVTDVERGTQMVITSNEAGEYVASPLRIGRYTVTVQKAGFKKAVRAGPVEVQHSGSASRWLRSHRRLEPCRKQSRSAVKLRNSKPRPRNLGR